MITFNLDNNVEVPFYATSGSVGMDVRANSILKSFKGDKEVDLYKLEKMQNGFKERGYIKIRAFERILFGTGLSICEIPDDVELQVRSRSGMSLKKGILVANQPGTIDPDYRGEIGVILYNSSPFLTTINKGDRIAQLVANKFERMQLFGTFDNGENRFQYDPKLDPTKYTMGVDPYNREDKGFGSTGN